MSGKKYKAIAAKVPQEAVSVEEAVTFLKSHSAAKFDETVELHIHLGVDTKKSDQSVRGSVTLPHGTPKQKRIAVITSDSTKQEEARQEGAVLVGGDDILAAIAKNGAIEADIVVATPEMMPKIAKVAKVLGPQGLMPNPKNGTVTPNPAEAVKELAGGKISFKMDSNGNVHEAIGKVSWDAGKVAGNADALIAAIAAVKPPAQKGVFLQRITLSSTMSPGIRISA